MKTEWITEHCMEIMPEFTLIDDNTYAQRTNFEAVEVGYTCNYRQLSVSEYKEIMERRNEIKQVVLETTNTAAYEDGYQAAMILLGGEE